MAARTSYPQGVPSYVDIGAPDVDKAARFYTALFGWEVSDAGPVEESGGYRMAGLRGRTVAGLGPAQDPGPPRWTTYITVDDAEAAVANARENGGTVYVEPMDVFTAGRMAVIADPAGAVFSVWQARDSIGSELVNEPGTLCWNELNSRAIDDVKGFYAALFGWDFEGGPEYTQFSVGGRTVGGMLPMPEAMGSDVPNHWMTYFAVADHDDAVAEVERLGGTVHAPGLSAGGVGRFAVVADDQGAVFCVIQLESAGD